MNINNLVIVIIIGALSAYSLYLGNTELAATGFGSLAGVLVQATKGVFNAQKPAATDPAAA